VSEVQHLREEAECCGRYMETEALLFSTAELLL